jgi:hypothetical protein
MFNFKHESEIYGRTMRVTYAKPGQKSGDKPGILFKLFI